MLFFGPDAFDVVEVARERSSAEALEEDMFAGAAALFGIGPENTMQAAQRNLAELTTNVKVKLGYKPTSRVWIQV